MSKSRGNVVDPDRGGAQVRRGHGARVLDVRLSLGGRRAVELGEYRRRGALAESRVACGAADATSEDRSPRRADAKVLRRITHQTIKKVTNDLEAYEFNTIIAALMTMTNGLYKLREATEGSPEWNEAIETLLLLMAPDHAAHRRRTVGAARQPVLDPSAERGRPTMRRRRPKN